MENAMIIQGKPVSPHDRPTEYQHLSLLILLEMIVKYSDRQALKELHDYRILYWSKDKTPFRLVEFIASLYQKMQGHQRSGYNERVLELAHDLTVDKFMNIPQSPDTLPHDRQQGPDCRNYFKAVLSYVRTSLHITPNTANGLSDELLTTKALRKQVERHFDLSILESRRRVNDLEKRYGWEVDGYVLYLWVPRSMPGRGCRKWLEDNIPHVNPTRSDEQKRVQAIINRLLPRPRIMSFNTVRSWEYKASPDAGNTPGSLDAEVTVKGLAAVVAQEKADNIHLQRPAIRRLGKAKLMLLILDVFNELAEGRYQEKQIAARYGLSNATLSRFAGSRWNKHPDDRISVSVPDLFRNTAQTLAGHSQFIAAARKAQVWKRVSQITNGGK
jgi:hypothetical protein